MNPMATYDFEYIQQTDEKATAAYIFLHGAGKTGKSTKQQFIDLMGEKARFPHIKIVFPTAPKVFFKLQGKFSNVWFNAERSVNMNFSQIKFNYTELDEKCRYVESLIEDLERGGIPKSRIIIGGWSQGGMLSMYAAFTKLHDIGGVAVISSMFPFVDAKIQKRKHPPLLLCQNTHDTHYYTLDELMTGIQVLMSVNVAAYVKMFDRFDHEILKEPLQYTYNWISSKLPKQ